MSHPLEESKTWLLVLVAFAVISIGVVYAISVASPNASPDTTPTPTPDPTVTPRATPPLWNDTHRATPIPRTPTPTPIRVTPSPTPYYPPRYCETNFITNITNCYAGSPPVPPTPTPSPTATPVPTPSPTPIPNWLAAGMKCEVPDRILSLPWVDAYKFPCTCAVRAQYQLGLDFSPFEGSYSTAAWREASKACVEIICAGQPGLC
jgi:hypothetical protein